MLLTALGGINMVALERTAQAAFQLGRPPPPGQALWYDGGLVGSRTPLLGVPATSPPQILGGDVWNTAPLSLLLWAGKYKKLIPLIYKDVALFIFMFVYSSM